MTYLAWIARLGHNTRYPKDTVVNCFVRYFHGLGDLRGKLTVVCLNKLMSSSLLLHWANKCSLSLKMNE